MNKEICQIKLLDMKKSLIIQLLFLMFPITSRSAVGEQIYLYPLVYTITKEVKPMGSSYVLGAVMIGINNGWGNGNAYGNLNLSKTIKYNNYEYVVDRLGKWAFRGNTKLTSITIPNTIRRIEEEAFLDCTSLNTITITPYEDKQSANVIETGAFNGCTSLETVIFNGTRLNVSANAFLGCQKLQSFPFDKVSTINSFSFAECESLSDITLSASYIGNNAFENCTSLTSVTFASNIIDIRERAFNGCRELKTVTSYMTKENFTSLQSDNCFSGINPEAVLYVPNGMISYYENDANWHAAFPTIKAIAPSLGETFSVSIPAGNESITLSFEVTNVENMEVTIISSDCNISTPIDLVIPTTINYQDWHFSITEIGPEAFSNIQNIHSVEVGWRQPVNAVDNFTNISNDAVLYVPAGTKQRYESIETWRRFSRIVEKSPLSVGDISACYGSKVNLPIILNNNAEVAGLQFSVKLPNGVSVAEDDGELKVSTTDRSSGMVIMARKDPEADNSYLFVMFSMEGNSITGNEGAVMKILLDVASDVEVGQYRMFIRDERMATPTYETIVPSESFSELTVKDFKLGDVNNEGSITAQDASLVQQLVAGKINSSTDGVVSNAADVNGDGIVTAQDASLIQQHVAGKIDISTINH